MKLTDKHAEEIFDKAMHILRHQDELRFNVLLQYESKLNDNMSAIFDVETSAKYFNVNVSLKVHTAWQNNTFKISGLKARNTRKYSLKEYKKLCHEVCEDFNKTIKELAHLLK